MSFPSAASPARIRLAVAGETAHSGVHHIHMGLQEAFNLLPAHGCLIHRSIAHFVSRIKCVYERCFDSGEHKFDEHRGFSGVAVGIDDLIVHWNNEKAEKPDAA